MFKNILYDLMTEKGINQRQLSIKAEIPPTTINGWLKADRLPDYNALIKLAAYFDVSTDYLLGLSDEYEGTGKSAPAAPAALPLDESELLRNYRALSYSGKARAAAYVDLLREQEEGSPSKISYRK